MLDEDAADDPRIGALGDLDDAAFRPPLAVDAGDPHQGAVAMQHLAHLVLFEKDVGRAVIGNQEAVAVRMPLNLSRRQAGPFRQDVGALAVAHQLAFALHGAEPALEHLALAVGDVEQLGEFGKRQRPAFIGQHLRNVLPRRQRGFVTRQFALVERVGAADLRWFFS